MFRRMGEILVGYGEISPEQLDTILKEQKKRYRPFGKIAAELYKIHETAIWRAWAEQYSHYCPRVNLKYEQFDPEVYKSLTPEDAWKHRLLPLREHDGDLILLTSEHWLPYALHFVDNNIHLPVIVWLVDDPRLLETILCETYPDCKCVAAAQSMDNIGPSELF